MGKKFIFFDIDGTLLDHDKRLPESTLDAVTRLKKAGHHVAISTGRGPFMFKKLREELEIHSYVSYNGQYVVREGEVIYENPLKVDALEQLIEATENTDYPLVFLSEEDMKANVEDHPFIHESLKSLHLSHPECRPDYFQEKHIYQALLFCKEGEEEQFNISEEIKFVRWHQLSTDVVPKKGSKAEGIKKIMDMLGVSRQDVVAFGDGLNDIEMISFAGTGVAMGNAVSHVKKVADFVTKPVDEDGIFYAAKQLQLI